MSWPRGLRAARRPGTLKRSARSPATPCVRRTGPSFLNWVLFINVTMSLPFYLVRGFCFYSADSVAYYYTRRVCRLRKSDVPLKIMAWNVMDVKFQRYGSIGVFIACYVLTVTCLRHAVIVNFQLLSVRLFVCAGSCWSSLVIYN